MPSVSVPEVVTPWLILITTIIGTTAAVSGVFFWIRRKFTALFVGAVSELLEPLYSGYQLIEERLDHIEETTAERHRVTARNFREVKGQITSVSTSVKMLEAKVAKSQESSS